MAIAESWHVRSRARECAVTHQPFVDGETIVTALYPDPESSSYVRRDYGAEGWESARADGGKPFSFWRSNYTAASVDESANAMEKLSPEELLRRLVDEDEDHTENTRYILAIMLERRKILKEADTQRLPDGILRVYEHRKSGEVYIVKDPDIPLADVEALQQEVFTLLENNGKAPAPVVSAEAENAEAMVESPAASKEEISD